MKTATTTCLSSLALLLLSSLSLVSAHTVLTYPGWRGNNLHDNETFPHGMQWSYPCGGMPLSTNRTKWPVRGGAIAVQPGWFSGHATAFFYINMGFGTTPPNMSFPMLPVFQIIGPTREMYPGTFCLPQVPLPANASVKVGDNATIQIIETAIHGAALFNCVDITFAEPAEVPEVNVTNCFNSTTIGFNQVYTAPAISAGTPSLSHLFSFSFSSTPTRWSSWLSLLIPLLCVCWAQSWL
ncbi:MAG: hypothetical protein M1823_006136 [Watsoniomyces obsoletus]|nr:MAG: hypothetical protein M1823_006136 [Watsoniomyces obsoletus]